jgi:hypothetical protein
MLATDHAVSRVRADLAEDSARAVAGFAEYPVSVEGFGAVEGLSAPETQVEFGPVVVVPRFVREMIAAQERCASDKAPNLTIAQWLHAQPPSVQQRERLRALRRLGFVIL